MGRRALVSFRDLAIMAVVEFSVVEVERQGESYNGG